MVVGEVAYYGYRRDLGVRSVVVTRSLIVFVGVTTGTGLHGLELVLTISLLGAVAVVSVVALETVEELLLAVGVDAVVSAGTSQKWKTLSRLEIRARPER